MKRGHWNKIHVLSLVSFLRVANETYDTVYNLHSLILVHRPSTARSMGDRNSCNKEINDQEPRFISVTVSFFLFLLVSFLHHLPFPFCHLNLLFVWSAVASTQSNHHQHHLSIKEPPPDSLQTLLFNCSTPRGPLSFTFPLIVVLTWPFFLLLLRLLEIPTEEAKEGNQSFFCSTSSLFFSPTFSVSALSTKKKKEKNSKRTLWHWTEENEEQEELLFDSLT